MRNSVAKKLRKLSGLIGVSRKFLRKNWNNTPRPARHEKRLELEVLIYKGEMERGK